MHNLKSIFIISFNGQEGSGKSTIAKMVAENLNCPRYYMGQILRDMAQERGLTLVEFGKLRDADPSFDRQVDDYMIRLSKSGESFVVESRTAWHFIPNSLKIYLKVDVNEAAKRVFKELQTKNNRQYEDKNLDGIEDIRASLIKRRDEDNKRYSAYYNIDQTKESNYDFVIDTTGLTIQEVFKKVMEFIENEIS